MADLTKLLEKLKQLEEIKIPEDDKDEFLYKAKSIFEQSLSEISKDSSFLQASPDRAKEIILKLTEGLNETIKAIERYKQRAGLPAVLKESPEIHDYKSILFHKDHLEKGNYLGEENGKHIWQKGPVKYRYDKDKQEKIQSRKESEILLPDSPKIGLSQLKNLDAISLLLQQENKKRELKGEPVKAEVEFYLSDYAGVRGYSKKELSGDSLAELKKDLYSGAIMTYWLEDIEYNGKKYTALGLPNFYVLLAPKHKKDKWVVIINEFYREMFLAKGRYYPIPSEVIADRRVSFPEYRFVRFLARNAGEWKQTGGVLPPYKFETVLNEIAADERDRSRPADAYSLFVRVVEYAYDKRLLKAIVFYGKADGKPSKAIDDLSVFKGWSYVDFKAKVLAELSLSDIRQTYLRFYNDKQFILPEKPEKALSGPAKYIKADDVFSKKP
jgi:hypothetical protein